MTHEHSSWDTQIADILSLQSGGAITDTLSPAARSERMSRVRGKDTKPEMLVRRLVHGLGYRYRLHGRKLPGAPDLVFPTRRKAIQVHGCFWHRHPDPECRLARLPKSRQEFWMEKLDGNRARDERNAAAIRALGWEQLELWECQLRDRGEVERRVIEFLGERNARH